MAASHGIHVPSYARELPPNMNVILADSDYEVHCSKKYDGFCVICKPSTSNQYHMSLVSKHGNEYQAYEAVKQQLNNCLLWASLKGHTVAGELVLSQGTKDERKKLSRRERFDLLKKIMSCTNEEYQQAWLQGGIKIGHRIVRLHIMLFDVLQAPGSLANMSYADRLQYLRTTLEHNQNEERKRKREAEANEGVPDNSQDMSLSVVDLTRVHDVQSIRDMEQAAYERNDEGLVVNIHDLHSRTNARVKLKKLVDVDAVITQLSVMSDQESDGWRSKHPPFSSFRYVIVNTARTRTLVRSADGHCFSSIMRIPWRGPPHVSQGSWLYKVVQLRVTLWRNEPGLTLQPEHIRHVWIKPADDPLLPEATSLSECYRVQLALHTDADTSD